MKKSITLLFTLFKLINSILFCQSITKDLDIVLDDNYYCKEDDYNYPNQIQETLDGGFIVGGQNTDYIRVYDSIYQVDDILTQIQIIKSNSQGKIEWQYELNYSKQFKCIEQTSDSGFIFGITHLGAPYGLITKLNKMGIKEWQIRIAPIDNEGELVYIKEIKSEGYIVVGESWMIKINYMGVIMWEKNFDTTKFGNISSIDLTQDGGFVIVGAIYLNGGNKIQLSKLDSLGNNQWDRNFNFEITLTDYIKIKGLKNGNYVIGTTREIIDSCIDNNDCYVDWDYRVIYLDSNGTMLWDKNYGGTFDEVFFDINETLDNELIIAGTSGSNVSRNKSAICYGKDDYWIVKLDTLGKILWDESFGGNDEDNCSSISVTSDLKYLLSGYSNSQNTGNKTSIGGNGQFWVVRFSIKDTTKTITAINKDYKQNDIIFSNLVTPNGDGLNDYFEVIGSYENVGITIYNNNGSLIYRNENYKNNWTSPVQGIYYFSIESEKGNFKGKILVVN